MSVSGEIAAGAIVVDGNKQVTAYADGNSGSYDQATNTLITECNQGSRVSIECFQNRINDNDNFYTSFSGFLIQAL